MGSLQINRRLPVLEIITLWIVITSCFFEGGECKNHHHHRRHHHHHQNWAGGNGRGHEEEAVYGPVGSRAHTAVLTDFGAVGDGVTSNTAAFTAAVAHLAQYELDGGAALVVPPGRWLTGPFNLTSHFTLFLERGAIILASQNISEWPTIDPLPSYGRGRDLPGPRYSNFITGYNLTDVIITGNNGTIDGQGKIWWDKFHNDELNYTRGYLVEIIYSDHVVISNVTFVNSPSWNIHPVYSSNVIVSGITILAPIDSPNTDGINPDSSSDVHIEDSFIVSGDDCVAIKSGWDEYGIAFNRSSERIIIQRLTCISPTSAVIAIGSEMSGGVRDVIAEDITAINSESGVRIKTGVGRGGFVKDIFVRRMSLHTMKWVFWMTGNYGQHPDEHYDPNALPEISGINYLDVYAENVTMAARLEGIKGDPFTGICISNVTAEVIDPKKLQWNCTNISGKSIHVSPTPCALLPDQGSNATQCPFPGDKFTDSVKNKYYSTRRI
ncbi:probable polygalacturonase [Ananas comosus]|uniref:Probable polygalacturonase n=1 Tax=Ananas comosus TaxID=4615 RepID=A0A6P5FBT8_ANACO|nr:probable polygalacturonase [Ananas comosus]